MQALIWYKHDTQDLHVQVIQPSPNQPTSRAVLPFTYEIINFKKFSSAWFYHPTAHWYFTNVYFLFAHKRFVLKGRNRWDICPEVKHPTMSFPQKKSLGENWGLLQSCLPRAVLSTGGRVVPLVDTSAVLHSQSIFHNLFLLFFICAKAEIHEFKIFFYHVKLDVEVAQTAITIFYLFKIRILFHRVLNVTTKQFGQACEHALFCKESM